MPIQAIVFDVFGTLAHIIDKRWPFAKLGRLGIEAGRMPQPSDVNRIMSANVDLAGAADMLGICLCANDLQALEAALAAALASIVLYPETLEVLQSLRDAGLKTGMCSNLAAPYGRVIYRMLDDQVDATVFSYRVNATKPESAIYRMVANQFSLMPEQILMVGDGWEDDVAGPLKFGMQAIHVARDGHTAHPNSVASLSDILKLANPKCE